MEVNSRDLLYFEKNVIQNYDENKVNYRNDAMSSLFEELPEAYLDRNFNKLRVTEEPNYDFRESIALSFKVHSQYLYGLPERAERLLLKPTEYGDPYRLYNLDVYQHWAYNQQSLYGSIPYLTAHSELYDTAIMWMNSAETFVDIYETGEYGLMGYDRND